MSEQAVDLAVARAGLSHAAPCRTKTLRLFGGRAFDPAGDRFLVNTYHFADDIARHLNRTYGDQAMVLGELALQGWAQRLHRDHPAIEAEVLYAVRQEDALHAVDVLARRLCLALVDRQAALACLPRVITLMAGEFGWNPAQCKDELNLAEQRLLDAL